MPSRRPSCKHCKKRFTTKVATAKYCSTQCGDSFRNRGKRKVRTTGEHYAYIHRILDNGVDVCIKFGIEVECGSRYKVQNRLSPLQVIPFVHYRFESKHNALDAERECKMNLSCQVIRRGDLPDGYTETTHVSNIERVVSIYVKHGGVPIPAATAARLLSL